MQDILKGFGVPLLWILFFASDLYGHVALKKALLPEANALETIRKLAGCWTGWSIFLAWGLAGLLWVGILSQNTLFETNSISMVNYVLVCLAAIYFLGENPTSIQWAGMGLIGLGVFFTSK